MKFKLIRKTAVFAAAAAVVAAVLWACAGSGELVKNDGIIENSGEEYTLEIEAGEAWLHDFPLFAGFKAKNPPQYAVWLEDLEGNYLETVVVTEKIATEGWVFNGGNRRVEALPYWMFRRSRVYSDGFMLPSSNERMADAVTAATPKKSSSAGIGSAVLSAAESDLRRLRIVAEFNHSTDFNEAWPADAVPADDNWSGGEMGSGQPAVVYAAEFTPDELENGSVRLELIGRSSADGSDGGLYGDVSTLTTALEIVSGITLKQNAE